MKVRLATAAVLVGVMAASTAGAQAAPKTLDGKKVKVLTFSATAAPQDHDSDYVTSSIKPDDRLACQPARCFTLRFRYQPAKGVKGGLAFAISWTFPAEDFDLYVAEIAKDGSASDVGHCGASAGTSEKVFLPAGTLKPGKTYAVIVDYYRASGAAPVKGSVTFPGTDTVKTSVPSNVDAATGANCGL